MYYSDKTAILQDLFAAKEVTAGEDCIHIDGKRYPVIDDVIILAAPEQYSSYVRQRLPASSSCGDGAPDFAENIQYTFGEEWKTYGSILPEHEAEFAHYFDLLPPASLRGKRVCDLGCGMGRWSYFLRHTARELVLLDFSDAVFVARRNLVDAPNCLFFFGDLRALPFRDNFADVIFSLGVLHHLPVSCLDEVRRLKRCAPQMLIFLYYALDNRPFYFRSILAGITALRKMASSVRNPVFRKLFSVLATYLLYVPLIALGSLLNLFGLGKFVPLYEFYHTKGLRRIEQDVYDRFFTSIEQRVTRREIAALADTYSKITISESIPYWHFLCDR